MLKVLGEVHKKGWVHRDLKPDNIFIQNEGVRLLDFGLVRTVEGDSDLTQEGTFLGTSEYCAPEQLTDAQEVDTRADLYAIGVILFELLTLRPPFVGLQAEVEHGHVAMRPPDPAAFAAIPQPVSDLVFACLQKDPSKRPADAQAARLKIDQALAATDRTKNHLSTSMAEPAPLRTAIRTEGRRPVVVVVIETKGDVGRVSGEIVAHSGFIARQRGQRFVCAFIGIESNPVHSALEAVSTVIRDQGGRAALHLAALGVRARRTGAVRVFGREVDKPELWLPEEWDGVLLTSAVATTLPDASIEAADIDGFFRPAKAAAKKGVRPNIPFVGQKELLDAAASSAQQTFESRQTRLCTLIGDAGSGKSRLLDEIANRVSEIGPDCKLYRLRARRAVAGDSEQPLRRILRAALMLPARASENDVKLACKVHLGKAEADDVMPSVMMALGLENNGRAPGRIRHDVTVAVGIALENTAKSRPVALLLDDADWADDTTLDALEYAMTRCQDLPLWVAVVGGARLKEARPTWGQRTKAHDELEIASLDEDSACQLAAHLLQPADRPPVTLLKRLAVWAAYNPASIIELTNSLHREGIVRPYEGSDAWYVDAEALDKLPSSPVRQWAAARMVQMLPAELADLIRICAVLGAEFSLDEVDAVQRNVSTERQIDPAVGLTQLAQRDIIFSVESDRHAFCDPSIQKGIYSQLGGEGKSAAHACAYDYWAKLPGNVGTDQLHRIAYHASLGDKPDEAITAYMALGQAAEFRNAHREAATAYTSALDLMGDSHGPLRLRALISRGKARRSYTHYEDAISDLESARELARALGDNEALVEATVEEAGACDFCMKLTESGELIDEAAELAKQGISPYVRARLLCFMGVVAWRRADAELAIESLNMAAVLARALNQHEAEVGPSLLLSVALLGVGKPEEGLAVLSDVIRKCEEKGDYENLAFAHANRCEFWGHYKDVDRARADIERVKQLAQEGGFMIMEVLSYHNLAELLLRVGDTRGALAATTEAYSQNMVRFKESPLQVVSLLHAQVLCHAGKMEEAVAVLEETGDCDNGFAEWCIRSVKTATAPDSNWDELIEFSKEAVSPEQVVTTMWLRARCSARAGQEEAADKAFQEAIEEALLIESDMARAIMMDRSEIIRSEDA